VSVSVFRQSFVLAIFAIVITLAQSQTTTQTLPPQPGAAQTAPLQATPQQTTATPATPPTTATAAPHVDGVTVFEQSQAQSASTQSQQSNYVLEIRGTGFDSIQDLNAVRIIVFPASGVTGTQVLSRSLDNSKILTQFTAPPNFTLQQVALSLSGSNFVTFDTGTSACNFNEKVKLAPQLVPENQAEDKYGHGVAKNFHIVQLSFVNECPMAIVVPLAGIKVVPGRLPGAGVDQNTQPSSNNNVADENGTKNKTNGKDKAPSSCPPETINGKFINLIPFSLDHITSIYSADRKLTGRRAIYFNVVQAAATIGSAIEPFFGHGFTQGVAILGGGFTTASKEIMVDMSTEQLQNITSQSFGGTEQISARGSLQKFVFIPKSEKCKESGLEKDLTSGKFSVDWELSPASTQAPSTQTAQSVTTPTAVK
jgi:hypothetical protein